MKMGKYQKIYLFRYLTTGKVGLCIIWREQKQISLFSSWKQVFDGEPRRETSSRILSFLDIFFSFSIKRWKLDFGWPDTMEQNSRSKEIFRKKYPQKTVCRVPLRIYISKRLHICSIKLYKARWRTSVCRTIPRAQITMMVLLHAAKVRLLSYHLRQQWTSQRNSWHPRRIHALVVGVKLSQSAGYSWPIQAKQFWPSKQMLKTDLNSNKFIHQWHVPVSVLLAV